MRLVQYMPENKVQYVSIADAYEELSEEAFSFWIRMHLLPENFTGKIQLIKKVLKKSVTRGYITLNELRLKGYLYNTSLGPRNEGVTFTLVKRAKISGNTRFLLLSPKKDQEPIIDAISLIKRKSASK